VWSGDGKIARSRAIRIFGIFKVGHFPIWELMANSEVTRLYFNYAGTTGSPANGNPNVTADVYIDLAAAMSAVNRKQYHQVKKDGSPLCYAISVTAVRTKNGMVLATAPNSWTTRNAVKKTAIGWKRQLKHGGVKLSDLPTYAKRFRCFFDADAHPADPGLKTLAKHLQPIEADQVTPCFSDYVDSMGDGATYENTNEGVLVPVGPDGAVVEYRMNLLGGTAPTEFGMIEEFLNSRRNIRDASDPTLEFPDADNLLDPLFATAEELSDDIVAAAEDYNTQRPYSEVNANDAYLGARFTTSSSGIIQRESMVAPLGLIKIIGSIVDSTVSEPTYLENDVTDHFFIDVHAIYEM